MKFALIALVLALSLAQSEAFYGMGWGGMMGGLYGGMFGGMYGGYGMGMGMGMWGKRSVAEMPKVDEITMQIRNRTECVYTKETEMLSCKGPSGIVECEVDFEIPFSEKIDFKLWAISKMSDSPVRYELIPRKLDNSAWEWVMVNGKKVTMEIFPSGVKKTGLEVEDKVCFNKMSELFTGSVRNEKIFIGSDAKFILGDLLVADKLPKMSEKDLKRHWGYGGYRYGGYGYGGYGMGNGGYGMSYGYGYYGKRAGMPAITEKDLIKMAEKRMEKSEKAARSYEMSDEDNEMSDEEMDDEEMLY